MKIFIALIFLLVGCSHTPKKPPIGYTQQDFLQEQAVRKKSLKEVSGRLRISFKSRSQRGTGDGQMVALLPDKIRLEVRDPIGKIQFLVTLDRSAFTAYYPSIKKAYQDKVSGLEYLKMLIGLKINFSQLHQLLLGVLPSKSKLKNWTWDDYHGLYVGDILINNQKFTVSVDPTVNAIRKITAGSGKSQFTVSYSSYRECCGSERSTRLARIVSVNNEELDTYMEVYWKDVHALTMKMKPTIFRYSPSPGVEIIFPKTKDL